MILERILFQNEACLVINKHKGEAVEGAKEGIINLPKEISAAYNKKFKLIEAVNRLDVPVTGCALFALNNDALVFLNNAFTKENAKVKKQYWAVIEKPVTLPPKSGELTHWIEVNPKINKSFAHNTEKAGYKKASLKYRITGEGDNYLFAEIELLSGRHHQIRAQLAAIGFYIKGDLKYGAKRSEKGGGIRLHARSLVFPDPSDINLSDTNPSEKVKKISVTAEPPESDNLWKAFPISPEL